VVYFSTIKNKRQNLLICAIYKKPHQTPRKRDQACGHQRQRVGGGGRELEESDGNVQTSCYKMNQY